MRYFAKFHDGSQTKNKAQVQSLAFMKLFASILLNSDAALEKMVSSMQTGIDQINDTHPRCSDINFRAYLHDDYCGKCVNVGDICSYSFYPVFSDFIVPEKKPEQKTEEVHDTKSDKHFEL